MSLGDLDDIDDTNSLSNSDLKGLLKAAKLTKYVPDNATKPDPVKFEKSANLFDLVRSKIQDQEKLAEHDGDKAEQENIDIAVPDDNVEVELDTEKDDGLFFFDNTETSTDTQIENILDSTDVISDDLLIKQDGSKEEKATILSDNDDLDSDLDSQANLKIEENYNNNSSESGVATTVSEEDPFLAAKLEFEKSLEIEKDNFHNLSETLFSVSQAIVDVTEEKLKVFILETASKLSGEKIDEIPESYLTKISGIINEFSTKTDNVKVLLNKDDLAALKKIKNFSKFLYSFELDENLMRGEFKVQNGKLMSQVKLFQDPKIDQEVT